MTYNQELLFVSELFLRDCTFLAQMISCVIFATGKMDLHDAVPSIMYYEAYIRTGII